MLGAIQRHLAALLVLGPLLGCVPSVTAPPNVQSDGATSADAGADAVSSLDTGADAVGDLDAEPSGSDTVADATVHLDAEEDVAGSPDGEADTEDDTSADTADPCDQAPPSCALQTGVCEGSTVPTSTCSGGVWGPCAPDDYLAQAPAYEEPEVTCDDLDNDCDGVTDEPFPELGQPCDGDDTDSCQEGVWTCEAGVASCTDTSTSTEETCDGVDNDCDGSTDEGVKNACGDCGEVPTETCNGQDDDCDGSTDEGVENACGDCGEVPPEVCNGIDDDCDGQTDEGVSNLCGGCGPVPFELCNGQDDDCDGTFDESMPAEDCGNEVDDDCDGDMDCADSTCADLVLCQKGCTQDSECGEGLGCTELQCVNNICKSFPACDDDNPCTVDLCSEEEGCAHVPQDLLSCSDSSLCTVDQCVNGACVWTPLEVDDYDATLDEVVFVAASTSSSDKSVGIVLGPGPETDWIGYEVSDNIIGGYDGRVSWTATSTVTVCVFYLPENAASGFTCDAGDPVTLSQSGFEGFSGCCEEGVSGVTKGDVDGATSFLNNNGPYTALLVSATSATSDNPCVDLTIKF